MSLLLASFLGLAQIQDIKVGQCLRGPEIQEFAGVQYSSLYYTVECGKPYPLAGDNIEHFTCGIDGKSGGWTRQIKEHDRPGFFWPNSVPCMSSVTQIDFVNAHFEDIQESLTCNFDNVRKISDRKESMKTKKYEIGQGVAYLPNPLAISVVEYDQGADGGIATKTCFQSEFYGVYKGWGSFEVSWRKFDCVSNKVLDCATATLSQSTDADGNDCALVKKVVACPTAPSGT